MDRPRQRVQTRWQRLLLLRTGVYAATGTAIAVTTAIPLIHYFAEDLFALARLPIETGQTTMLLAQGSTFVFAYLWLAFYMLERAQQRDCSPDRQF